MKEFIKSIISSKGEMSSKRIIALLFSCFAIWAGIYIVINYEEQAITVFGYSLLFIGTVLGVYTLPDIIDGIKQFKTLKTSITENKTVENIPKNENEEESIKETSEKQIELETELKK